MKQVLSTAATSIITGICFAAGITLVIWIAELIEDNDQHRSSRIYVDNPQRVTILNHHQVVGTRNFTIQGTIENDGEYSWENISIKITIFASGVEVNSCDDDFDYIQAKSVKAFQVECHNTTGAGLPDNITYKVEVESGSREKNA